MGIRFSCPNGHKLNVKAFLAGKRAICPDCGVRVIVPEVPSQTVAPSFADIPAIAAVGKPAAHEFVEPDASSIALAIEDEELSLAPPLEPPVVTAPPADLPDSIIAATTPSVVTPTPVTGTPESAYDRQRERTRRNQTLMALALLFVVVVLAGILIWVLKRSAAPAPPSEPAPEKTTTSLISPTHVLSRAKV